MQIKLRYVHAGNIKDKGTFCYIYFVLIESEIGPSSASSESIIPSRLESTNRQKYSLKYKQKNSQTASIPQLFPKRASVTLVAFEAEVMSRTKNKMV